MKPLVVFDIDGTITDTVEVDDFCFVKTFHDLFDIDLNQVDWGEFKYVTDLGISNQIFEENFQRPPTNTEIESIKTHFLGLLSKRFRAEPTKFSEIPGAANFLKELKAKSYPIAIATGGWKETAIFKLEKVGVRIENIPFANSNHHYSRAAITKLSIESAKETYQIDFKRTVYFGDGEWDLVTCREIGVDFIGVDYKETGVLKKLGAANVIEDFSDTENLLRLI